MEVFYFYASGRQGHSPCTHRIRFADADRLAHEITKIFGK
jgi:hypothetical protein